MGLAAILQHRQTGVTFAVGPRDEAFELTGMAGRMTRALRNLHETLPWFATVVLVAHVSGNENEFTLLGAHLYFWARVAYVPAYASGLPWIRTVVWWVAGIGIALVAAQLF